MAASNIGMMDGAYFVRRNEILAGINTTLQLGLSMVEEAASGAVACQLMDAAHPGAVLMQGQLRRQDGVRHDPELQAIIGTSHSRRQCSTECSNDHCSLAHLNLGEEISLRLRTDDLKGFRKYESIKKTLLHELAHMVHSEHDAKFFALNKQLYSLYRSQFWALADELPAKHGEYWWDHGASPVVKPPSPTLPPPENGCGDAASVTDGAAGGMVALSASNCAPLPHSENGSGSAVTSVALGVRSACSAANCAAKAMPLTPYCFRHILLDPKQQLYKPCSFVTKQRYTSWVFKDMGGVL